LGSLEGGGDPDVVLESDANPVRQQVPDRDVTCDVRVLELEAGEMATDRVVPVDDALVDEHPERRDGERLRRRRDGEEGVLVDRCVRPVLSYAVTTGEDHRIVPDDGDRQAGDAPVLPSSFDVG